MGGIFLWSQGESNNQKSRCPMDICCHQFKNWWQQIYFLLVESGKYANRFPSAFNRIASIVSNKPIKNTAFGRLFFYDGAEVGIERTDRP